MDESDIINTVELRRWRSVGRDIVTRQRTVLTSVIDSGLGSEEIIGDLATKLHLRELEAELHTLLTKSELRPVILVDRLDEGYEHDAIGIAFIDGAIYGLNEFCSSFPDAMAVLFLRDNIFRGVAQTDPDFSRNVEGQSLRLHWDTYQLFNMVCNRLRIATGYDIENNQRLWDRCTANELQHQDGFKRCLQLTLYRPRDLIILLNQAFSNARRQERQQIVLADIEASAQYISNNRLTDLHTEYATIFPGLRTLTSAFLNRNPELSVSETKDILITATQRDEFPAPVQQDLAIFRDPNERLRNLYSVGFLGIHEKENDTYTFCHDGSQPDRQFKLVDKTLIHPCYWLALNLTRNILKPDEAESINDEYEIEAVSTTPGIRNHKLGQLITALDKIPLGDESADVFEDWCANVIGIIFAGRLRNIQLHPNRHATQRRDVVATNLSTDGSWHRIYQDYKTRQVIFEIKNYEKIGMDEYRQVLSYLCDEYGKAGFIVTRGDSHNLTKGTDLDHFLELYHKHHVLIVKLTGKYLCTMLSKLRNPQKHDAPDNLLGKLLDTYSRLYMSGVTEAAARTLRTRDR